MRRKYGFIDSFNKLNRGLLFIVCVLIVLIMIIVCAEVVTRTFLNYSIFWVVEIAEYSLLFITFLGAAWLLGRDEHVRMDMLVLWLGRKARYMTNAVTSFIGAVISLIFTWYGIKVTWTNYQQDTFIQSLIEPPAYIIYWIIPLGSFLLFIQFLIQVRGYYKKWKAE